MEQLCIAAVIAYFLWKIFSGGRDTGSPKKESLGDTLLKSATEALRAERKEREKRVKIPVRQNDSALRDKHKGRKPPPSLPRRAHRNYWFSVDVSPGIDVYALGYCIKEERYGDAWTGNIYELKYSENRRNIVDFFGKILEYTLPALVDRLGLANDRIGFVATVRASSEFADDQSSLAKLAKRCAKAVDGLYMSYALTKNRTRSQASNKMSREQRHQNQQSAGWRCKQLLADHIFIVDDVVTTGTTMKYIAKAISRANPHATVYGIVLGRYVSSGYGGYWDNSHLDDLL